MPVVRTGNEVTNLGAATASFPATSPTADSGLDAGLEIGPTPGGTTFFTSYLGIDASQADMPDVAVIGERPGGVGGAETKFDLRALTGLNNSPTGLTFSPLRIDPGTNLQQMQVGILLGLIDDIGLTTSATPGLYPPVSRQLFVVVLPTGMGGIQYVPGGMFAGERGFSASSLRSNCSAPR